MTWWACWIWLGWMGRSWLNWTPRSWPTWTPIRLTWTVLSNWTSATWTHLTWMFPPWWEWVSRMWTQPTQWPHNHSPLRVSTAAFYCKTQQCRNLLLMFRCLLLSTQQQTCLLSIAQVSNYMVMGRYLHYLFQTLMHKAGNDYSTFAGRDLGDFLPCRALRVNSWISASVFVRLSSGFLPQTSDFNSSMPTENIGTLEWETSDILFSNVTSNETETLEDVDGILPDFLPEDELDMAINEGKKILIALVYVWCYVADTSFVKRNFVIFHVIVIMSRYIRLRSLQHCSQRKLY